MFGSVRQAIQLILFRRQWRKINSHNETVPTNIFNIDNVVVGKSTYGSLNIIDWCVGVNLKIKIIVQYRQE